MLRGGVRGNPKRRTEAPVNGGRNYNGPKVKTAALVKFGHMLETPMYLALLEYSLHRVCFRDNVTSADNQQERLEQ